MSNAELVAKRVNNYIDTNDFHFNDYTFEYKVNFQNLLFDEYLELGEGDSIRNANTYLSNFLSKTKGSEIFCGLILKTCTRFGIRVNNSVMCYLLANLSNPHAMLVFIYIIAYKTRTLDVNFKLFEEKLGVNRTLNQDKLMNLYNMGDFTNSTGSKVNYFLTYYSVEQGLNVR